jgi:hypothetical protein
MFILLFSMLSYWTGTPITSLTNPDYRAYDSPYNYNNFQIGAGWQTDGLDIKLGGSYMINKNWIFTGHYQNYFLNDGDFPTGENAYDSKFSQSDVAFGALYRMPLNSSLDWVVGGELGYDWYKDRETSSTAEEIVGIDYDDHSVGIKGLTGLRYSLTRNIDLGADIGAKYAYDRTYFQTSAEMNYYFTENIALGGRASYEDHDGNIGFYIRVSN